VTYEELVDEVIERAFPEGYAANLRPLYEKRILDGLIEAQRWVPYLKQRQFKLYPYGGSYYKQGATVIRKPCGKVKRLSVFSSKTLKDQVFYDYCNREDIDRLLAQRARLVEYPDAVPQEFGMFAPDSSLDKGWRAERGLFCIDKDQITILPHIESTERICVEYDGSKTSFEDDDVIDWEHYQPQVIAMLENWLRWKSVGKDDRSSSDYVVLEREWRESIFGLQKDTKDDTEAEIPVEDIGILPRTILPAPPEMVSALSCSYDPTNTFFPNLWVMCLGDSKYYSLGALLLDGAIVELIDGEGLGGGKPEVTYETIRVTNLHLQASNENFYQLQTTTVDDEPTHGFVQEPSEDVPKRLCSNVATINVDVLGTDGQTYYRLNLVLQDGVPILQISVAPEECDSEVTIPTACSKNVLVLKDVVTQKCIYVRIKDGQISISDS
jgi:hypothetical protein